MGLILAGVYAGLDQEAEARKVYRKLLAKDLKNEDACIFLSKSLAVSNEISKAINQLKTCAKNDRKSDRFMAVAGRRWPPVWQIRRAGP